MTEHGYNATCRGLGRLESTRNVQSIYSMPADFGVSMTHPDVLDSEGSEDHESHKQPWIRSIISLRSSVDCSIMAYPVQSKVYYFIIVAFGQLLHG